MRHGGRTVLARAGLARTVAAGRCRRAVTAVETALIMAPFLTICFGVIETAMLYYVAAALEGQVAEASRQIRTGNVQDSANPQAAFAALLYGNLQNLIACENVVIDVRRFASFSTVNYPEYVDTDGNAANAQFVPGNPGDVVLVRVTYRWQLLTPFLDHLMADTGSTKFLGAAALFRNEPYRRPIG